MLYDPKWKKSDEPVLITGITTLKGLISWLRTRSTNETYDYMDTSNCLLCQYAQAHGFKKAKAGSNYIREFKGNSMNFFDQDVSYVVGAGEKTFGAALQRAETLLNGVK
jgi:hypothetical protein